MQCPVCTTNELVMTDRQGVEIDYCPKCRGVWLDRGELDKIIERAAGESAPRAAEARPAMPYAQTHRDHDSDDDYRDGRRPYKKKKSLLRELFDFD